MPHMDAHADTRYAAKRASVVIKHVGGCMDASDTPLKTSLIIAQPA